MSRRMFVRLSVCLSLVVACSAAALYARDKTITVPDNVWSRYGLLCTPTKWTSIVAFYFGNYVAHLATVRTLPGEVLSKAIMGSVLALVFPSFGVAKGLDAVWRCARIRGRKSPLQTAAHSGALCMVVRSKTWTPQGNQRMAGVILSSGDDGEKTGEHNSLLPTLHMNDPSNHNIAVYRAPCLDDGGWFWGHHELDILADNMNREIHGTYLLPEGYEWALVPRHAVVRPNPRPALIGGKTTDGIAASYSATKAGASLFQTVYTAITLYRARGDQITRYGYAAFGLTVAPYAVMSVVNLFGSLLTPDYSSLYMVHSDMMQEAMDRGGCFDGVVGMLESRNRPFTGPSQHSGILRPTGRGAPSHDFIVEGTVTGADPIPRCFGGSTIIVPNHPNFERTDISTVSVDMSNGQGYTDRCSTYAVRSFFVCLLVTCIPVVLVGYLSDGFKPGESTTSQRAWTMSWLLVGTQLGYLVAGMLLPSAEGCLHNIYFFIVFVGYFVPASGGLYVVGGMLKEFGNCVKVY